MTRILIIHNLTQATEWSGSDVADAIDTCASHGWDARDVACVPVDPSDASAVAAADAVTAWLEAHTEPEHLPAPASEPAREPEPELPYHVLRAWEDGEPTPLRCPLTGREVRRVRLTIPRGQDWHGIVPGATGPEDPLPRAKRTGYWVGPGEEAPDTCVLLRHDGGFSHLPVAVHDDWAHGPRHALRRELVATSTWLPAGAIEIGPYERRGYDSDADAREAWEVAERTRREEAAERAKARAREREKEAWEKAQAAGNPFAALAALKKED